MRRSTTIGILIVSALVLVLVFLKVANGGSKTETAGGYKVRAIFSTASYLQSGLDVKIAGVRVGSVTKVELTPTNFAAVSFKITNAGFQDFRSDASCIIRPTNLIGERYLECTPTETRPAGAIAPPPLPVAQAGPNKGYRVIQNSHTSVSVDPDELLAAWSMSARDRLGLIISSLGAGVAGRGDEIARTLASSDEALTWTNKVLKQLATERTLLRELDSEADTVVTELASQRQAITSGIESGANVTTVLATHRAALQRSIQTLDGLFQEVPKSAASAEQLIGQLQPIADDLNSHAKQLGTILDQLPELSTRGTTAIKALAPTVQKGAKVLTANEPLISRIVNLATATQTTVQALGPALNDLRSTGGLDYLFQAIYGIAMATNGRDASGSYLRAALVNLTECAVPNNVKPQSCGNLANRKSEQSNQAAAARVPTGSSVTSSSATQTAKQTQLLFGGSR